MSKSEVQKIQNNAELLRLSTCGSVDDGKSTLIGRMLYDSKSLFQDQLTALENASKLHGDSEINLGNLTDGLRAEREQGITIDVAYRYFATPKRKFIIADTPGHIQYTRNMATGASTANLAVILVDSRKGVIEQTRRHSYIASLLGIPHIVLCINKLDLLDYSEHVFTAIRENFENFSSRLGFRDISYIPMSALKGDNVVESSNNMPWYSGPTFLQYLEDVNISEDRGSQGARFPVQWVIRPRSDAYHDFRGYAGQIASGTFRVGDEVMILPSQIQTKIKGIRCHESELELAFAPMSVTILLEDDVDISRGDMLVKVDDQVSMAQELDAMVCWMSSTPMISGKKYQLKQTTRKTKAIIKELVYRVDINSLNEENERVHLELNEIGLIKLKTQNPLIFDEYSKNRITGSFILIDESTHATVGAGMICSPADPEDKQNFERYII